jgi:hypothetical protein
MELVKDMRLTNGDRARITLRLETVTGVNGETVYHMPTPPKFLRVSISGEIAPKGVRFGTDCGAFGQIYDRLPKPSPLYNAWRSLHLNDMRAGCIHQDSTSQVGDVCNSGYSYGSKWLTKLINPAQISDLLRLFGAPDTAVIVSRDSVAVAVFPDYPAAMEFMHNNTSSSIDWAVKYEGWDIYTAQDLTPLVAV